MVYISVYDQHVLSRGKTCTKMLPKDMVVVPAKHSTSALGIGFLLGARIRLHPQPILCQGREV